MKKNNKMPLFETQKQKYQQTSHNFVLINQIHLNDNQCIPSQYYRQSKNISRTNIPNNKIYSNISRIKQTQSQNPDSKYLINKGLSKNNNKPRTFISEKISDNQINEIIREVIAVQSSPVLLSRVSKNFKEITRVTSEPEKHNKEIAQNKVFLHNDENEIGEQIKVNRPNAIFNFTNYYENQKNKIIDDMLNEKTSRMRQLAQKQEQQYHNREYYYEKSIQLAVAPKNKSHKFEKQPVYSQRQFSEKSFYLKQKDILQIKTNTLANRKGNINSFKNYK